MTIDELSQVPAGARLRLRGVPVVTVATLLENVVVELVSGWGSSWAVCADGSLVSLAGMGRRPGSARWGKTPAGSTAYTVDDLECDGVH